LDAAGGSGFTAVYLNRHRFSKQHHCEISRSGKNKPLRVFILGLSVLLSVPGTLVSANVANAGPSTTDRDLLASVDPATVTETTQETEDQIGLDRGNRRDVQRRLTRLGFDTQVNGRFDESTRAVITRWQAARGYPKTGFLDTLQHQALLSESVSAAHASVNSGDKSDDDSPARRPGGSGTHHHRSGGGPGGLIGGVVGGLFGRR
jgi:peptidoglycan hydrolase-like protein with peptidoglycan-binding domain